MKCDNSQTRSDFFGETDKVLKYLEIEEYDFKMNIFIQEEMEI